jgi:preprotein translocase subunit SecF
MFKNSLNLLIAAVWLLNGLYCKVLDMVPRHTEIVGTILGEAYARQLTVLIGVAEIGMAIWILSRYRPRICAVIQIAVVATMNTLEYFLVPDLLLWGKLNSFFALLFIIVIYVNEFHLNKTSQSG